MPISSSRTPPPMAAIRRMVSVGMVLDLAGVIWVAGRRILAVRHKAGHQLIRHRGRGICKGAARIPTRCLRAGGMLQRERSGVSVRPVAPQPWRQDNRETWAMRVVLAVYLGVAGVACLPEALGQGKEDMRYGFAPNLDKYPQQTPQKALES